MAKSKVDINALLGRMSISDKVGQLVQFSSIYVSGKTDELTGPAETLGLSQGEISRMGTIIGFSDTQSMLEIQKNHMENDPHGIPLIFMKDVIHGYRTVFPIPLGLSGSFDPELAKECFAMSAKEASAAGVQVTFTPMVDYVRDARWGRVMESCGEDQLLASVMGAAQVEAIQGDDVSDPDKLAACVKHFAAYGGAEGGRDYNTTEISERALREYYFPAYKACVDAGVKMLMPSFNSLNGVPSVGNDWLMNGVLRDEWGFDGVVISDWAAIRELCRHGVAENNKDASLKAFECGCHIDMMSNAYNKFLEELVTEGKISEEALDGAVAKVLELKAELGLFDDPYHGASAEKYETMALCPEHRAIAKKAADESAVLLKNNGSLPFSDKCESVAIIGPLSRTGELNGKWSCAGLASETVTVEQGVRRLLPNAKIECAQGCEAVWNDYSKEGFDEAIALAKRSERVILCLGEPEAYSGEGACRTDIRLPGAQEELAEAVIAANPNTVAVIFSGRPLALGRLNAVAPAILHMWFPGSEGGSSVADIVFGRVNPSGKLAMSFPKSVGQCPVYYNHPSTGRPKSIEMDDTYKPFSSNYIDCGNLPLFPFGHGLSYSNFVYESLELDTDRMTKDSAIKVRVTVRNDSDIDGKEVVQLYMQDLVASSVRPVQSLIAFEKVMIGAGERAVVEFEIREPMLRFYDAQCRHISEAGDFNISCGYADNLILTKKFTLE